MDKIKSKGIIRKHFLIRRKESRAILKNIRENKNFISTFKDLITEVDYNNLKNKYNEKVSYLKNNQIVILPKNLPFLYLIKDMTPDFSWKTASLPPSSPVCWLIILPSVLVERGKMSSIEGRGAGRVISIGKAG